MDGKHPHAQGKACAVGRIPSTIFRRLTKQASLQLQAREDPDSRPPFELLPGSQSSDVGLSALPAPSPGDAFFDLEGFPFASLPAELETGVPDVVDLSNAVHAGTIQVDTRSSESRDYGGGREYLWGISTRPSSELEPAMHSALCLRQPGPYFSWWAHNKEEERAAFVAVIEWITARMSAFPEAHVYHYGAYEVSTLRRLAGRYGTCEQEVGAVTQGLNHERL